MNRGGSTGRKTGFLAKVSYILRTRGLYDVNA